jgi:hypothetical protein
MSVIVWNLSAAGVSVGDRRATTVRLAPVLRQQAEAVFALWLNALS